MNPSPLVQKINNHLANLRGTAHRLSELLANVESLPPTHEIRLATKLGDMNAELLDLVGMTESLLVEEKP